MKSISILKHNLMRATMTLALMVTCATAWATSGNWSNYKATAFSSASGTTINITSEAELALFAYNVTVLGEGYSGYTITLIRDLNMSAHYWDKPIGLYDENHDNTFMGTFDGGNHTISGIYTSNSTSDYQGLFGFVGRSFSYDDPNVPSQSGTVRNLTLASSTITGKENVGGIAAYLWNGTISNCHVLSSVSIQAGSSNSKYHGGIVGQITPGQISQSNPNYNSATVQNCTCGASITSGSYSGCSDYGGIVGSYNRNTSTLTGCFYNGTSISANSNKGAIIGSCTTTSGISNCYYYYPSTINGIGSGGSVSSVKQVYKLTLATTDLTISSSPTYTFNGTNYYASATVTTTSNTHIIKSLGTTSGTISNITYSNNRHSATFNLGSGDVTLTVTLQALSGNTSDGLTWSLSGTNYTTLTISGNGAMQNYGHTTVDDLWRTDAPWGYNITSVTIGNGVTSIGDYAFVGCQNLSTVNLGSGITSIGNYAFDHCDPMTQITLPASVTTLGNNVFAQCGNLERVNFMHDGAITLGNSGIFTNCNNLQYLVFPSPAGAMANTAGNWSGFTDKLRASLGNQIFKVTNEGGTNAYDIATASDLNNLSTAVNGGANGSGQTFRQTADISVNNFTPIGSSQTNYFGGTYDGGNKTLTVTINDTGNQGTALFRNIKGATIKNLILTGSVTGTIHAAALVGFSRPGGTNTIDCCKVAANVTVNTATNNNYHCGGVVGHALTSTLNISKTLYCGTITNSGNYVGGFQGWSDGSTVTISDCLFVGTYTGTTTGTAAFHPIALRNTNSAATAVASNTYYDKIPTVTNSNFIAADGKKTTAVTTAPSNLGSTVATLSYMTVYQHGILYNGNYYAAPELPSGGTNIYLINNAAQWTAFCDMLYDNATYNRFKGKTVKLGANITVTRMAGSSNHDFCGSFDGQNYTLTFNYGSSTAYANEEYIAPFSYVSNVDGVAANFNNLKVAGTIYTSAQFAAGLVGAHWGDVNIQNCRVSTVINSSIEGDGTHGGIVGVDRSGTLTITGCVFDGQLLGSSTNACGGIVGFRINSATTNIYYTLFAPTNLTIGTDNSATFIRNATNSCNDGCYYTQEFNDGEHNITGQGQKAYAFTTQPANIGTLVQNYGMVEAYTNGLKFNNKYYVNLGSDLTINADGTEYTIHNATGWDLFCGLVESGETFSGKTVKLDADISVTRMAGIFITNNNKHAFSGAFNGQNHTLTFTCTAASSNYVAPFGYVKGGNSANGAITICNLNVLTTITAADYRHIGGLIALQEGHVNVTDCNANVTLTATKGTNNPSDLYPAGLVSQASSNDNGTLTISRCTTTGTITTDGKYAAGLVGVVQGTATIEDCVSSVTINSSTNGDGTHGGLVAVTQTNSTTTIKGCLFNGKLLSVGETATDNCGGFVGWRSGSLTISNSLYAPNVVEGETWINDSESATFVRNPGTGTNAATITNCYYVTPLGAEQGKQQRSVTAGENVTIIAIALIGNTTATYNVSGITAYSNGGLSLGNTLYYGNQDQVSLTLSNNPPAGYGFNGYTVSGGTLDGAGNPYTLTMPDADVTIGAEFELQTVSVTYLNANGDEQTVNAVPLTGGGATTLAAGWYVVNSDISYTGTVTLGGNVNLILCDGYTMNIGTNESRINAKGITKSNYETLTIFSQSTGSNMGTLSIYTCGGNGNHVIYTGTLTINGGNVIANTDGYFADALCAYGSGSNFIINGGNIAATATGTYANALFAYNNLTINGGIVNANGKRYGICVNNNVTLNGGTVSATCDSNSGNGIFANNAITLGWTKPSDRITASSYNGTVSVAPGQAFLTDEATPVVVSGTISDLNLINGKTLSPAVAVTLNDGITAGNGIYSSGDNLYANVGHTVTVDASNVTVPDGYTLSSVTVTPTAEVTPGDNNTYSFTVPAEDVTVNANIQVIEWSGNGTSGSPYIIVYPSQLDLLAARVNNGNSYQGKYFKLGADIVYPHSSNWNDLNSTENNYTAIGNANTWHNEFQGHFDGDGHTISGIRIYKPNNEYQGIFGYADYANIHDLTLADTRITGGQYVGGIAGNNVGSIVTHCYVAADVAIQSNSDYIGGIVGGNWISSASVTHCTSAATLTAGSSSKYYGGIVGCKDNGSLEDNLAIGATVPAANNNTHGAICGININGTLARNYYYNCTVAGVQNATGKGCNNADITANDGAVSIHTLTLGNNLTTSTDATVSYNETNYYKSGITVTVGVSAGYTLSGSPTVNPSVVLTDNGDGTYSFTMPATNVTVNANLDVIDWATESNGDDEHPYMIYNKDQLDLLAQRVNSGNGYSGSYFKLGADITYPHTTDWNDATSTEDNYTAIGGYYEMNRFFKGHFDGDGHTISGIRIYKGDKEHQGLFGWVSEADIHDLTLADVRITGGENTGGIVGANSLGTIARCHVASNVAIHADHDWAGFHGGIAGHNNGTLSHCTSAVTLTIADNATDCSYYGAIVGGTYYESTIEDNLAIGATVLAAPGNFYGAICGQNDGALARNYYYNCTVAGVQNATGKGCNNADITANDGAVSIHTLTLGNNLTTVSDATVSHNETDYYKSGITVTVGVSAGYTLSGSLTVTPSVELTDNGDDTYSFTMPAADVTVNANLNAIEWSGNGISWDPYIIIYPSQLDLLAHRVNGTHGETQQSDGYSGKYFRLDADIVYPHTSDLDDLTSTENNYEAIGGKINDNWRYFQGHFDGNNHTISGIRIYKPNDDYQGIFGETLDADIHDLTLADTRIIALSDAGGIAGRISNWSNITRCHVATDVAIHVVGEVLYSNGGGIVGCNDGGSEVTHCTSAATITRTSAKAMYYSGGIAGWNRKGDMSDNLVIGATVPTALSNGYGAICGYLDNGTFARNYYYNCTVAGVQNATGVGCHNADITNNDGAVSIHTLTLGDNLTTSTDATVTYNETDYYKNGLTVIVDASVVTVPEGYTCSGITVNENDNENENIAVTDNGDGTYSFTMPAEDVTVSANIVSIEWSGSGTPDDPYIIMYPSQLDLLAYRVNGTHGYPAETDGFSGKYFKLNNDIEYTYTSDWDETSSNENNYEAIGYYGSSSDNRPFKGDFDGNNKTVSGIRIYNTNHYQGLFGYTEGANIHDLTLADTRFTGMDDIGGIVGRADNNSTISHCTSTATVAIHSTGQARCHGGIVGWSKIGSTIDHCTSAVTHTIPNNAESCQEYGGIVGINDRGTISHCISTATLTIHNGATHCTKYGGIVGGIVGGNICTLNDNLVIGATIPATPDNSHGAICGYNSSSNTKLERNYYYNCTVAGVQNATGVGCGGIKDANYNSIIADITDNDGAVPGNVRVVEGYGTSEEVGWTFIASPLTADVNPDPTAATVLNIFNADEYDLYRLNPSSEMWENWKQGTNNVAPGFSLENGRGYLYATQQQETVKFIGENNAFNMDDIKNVTLPKGFNLVGNPFPRAAYINKPYYTLNDDGSAVVTETSTGYISPCTGVVVQVENGSETVTFRTTPFPEQSTNNNGNLNIALTQTVTTRGGSSTATLDNAIVSFNEGSQLGKFYFGTQNANIYLPQDGKEYAIVSAGNVGEIPVNFKAHENGTYTLTVSSTLNSKLSTLNFNYLHLIDNMTGADVDLLQTPEYTFNAKVTDYESRFRLVFVCGDANDDHDGDNETFAFFFNGSWIIANEGQAILQVIDLNGRILSSETVNGSVSKSIHAAPGVYMIRLINGENVKVQKVVIE